MDERRAVVFGGVGVELDRGEVARLCLEYDAELEV